MNKTYLLILLVLLIPLSYSAIDLGVLKGSSSCTCSFNESDPFYFSNPNGYINTSPDLSGLVPYTGSIGNVDLGNFNLSAKEINVDGAIFKRDTYTRDLTSGIVSYYRFEENTNNPGLVDDFGFSSGVINNSNSEDRSVLAKLERGLYFKNSTAHRVVLNESYESLITSRLFTISIWVKPEVIQGTIWAFQRTTTSNGLSLFMNEASSEYRLVAVTGTSSSTYSLAPVVVNEWTHIVVRRNLLNLRTYINGKLVHEVSHTGSPTMSTPDGVRIGGQTGSTTWPTAILDEFAIWSRPLEESEIYALYNMGAGSRYNYSRSMLGISDFINVDGYVVADGYITKSKVANINEDSLKKLDNMDKWKKNDGSINYEEHYAYVDLGNGKKGLSMETRVAEMEKMIWELNNIVIKLKSE